MGAVAAMVLVSACSGDDDDTAASTTTATADGDSSGDAGGSDDSGSNTDQGSGSGDGADPNGESALGGDPQGTAVMTVGAVTIEADVAACTLLAPDVAVTAHGETATIEMTAAGGGDTHVTVTGALEFEGNGTATFADDASIDQGDVTITGTGAQPDDAAPVEDFTLEVHVDSC